jgi:translation initiation factor eIF-2B subunit delta
VSAADDALERAGAALAADREHGAGELARQALRRLAELAGTDAGGGSPDTAWLQAAARRLAETRPSMTPLVVLTRRWSDGLEKPGADAARLAEDLIAASEAATGQAAAHMAARIAPGATVLTHSLSATVRAALCRAAAHGDLHVVVSESRPLNEGVTLARALLDAGARVTLITDAQIGLAATEADLALAGADTVLADGAVINKAGTRLLALAAREAGIPFDVCCETAKFRPADLPDPALEEMDPGELGLDDMPSGLEVRNTYFDVTPAALVRAIVTEDSAPS